MERHTLLAIIGLIGGNALALWGWNVFITNDDILHISLTIGLINILLFIIYTLYWQSALRAYNSERHSVFLRNIVDTIPDPIFVKNECLNLVAVNKAYEEMVSETAEDLIGTTGFQSFDPEQTKRFRAHDHEVFEKGFAVHEREMPHSIHGKRFYEVHKRVFNLETGIKKERFIVGICRDLTERIKSINALKRSNEELEEFGHIASHDLKEPLRGIHNYASFLEEDYRNKLDAGAKTYIDGICDLTKRMEDTVNSLFYFSRISRQEEAIQETDFNKVVQDVLSMMQPMIDEYNVIVTVRDNLPQTVCNQARMTEVIRNLMVNGIKYNQSAKKTLEIGVVEQQDEGASETNYIMYIRDNGIGIADKHKEIVFRMFKRLHKHDDFGGGTGSGLAIVKKILERYGQKIWLDSTLDQGSTFFFTLPKGESVKTSRGGSIL